MYKSVLAKKNKIHLFFFVISLFLVLVVFLIRKNSFQDFIINIDETLWFYNLKSLTFGIKPYLDFDPTTSGPFSIYFLKIVNFMNPSDLGDLRLNTLLSIICIVYIILNYFTIYFDKKFLYTIFIIFLSFLTINNYEFFAYNTEWIVHPFLFIFYFVLQKIYRNKSNLYEMFFFMFLIFSLPLIKFQFILFSIFTFAMTLLFTFIHKKTKLLLYVFLVNIILFVSFFHFTIGLEKFTEYYLFRNLEYAKFYHQFKYFDTFDIYNNKFIFFQFLNKLQLFFLPHFILLFLLFTILIFNKKLNFYNLLKCNKLEIGFFIISLFSIYIPKNNYDHYFQICFIPFSILISKLLSNLKPNYAIVLSSSFFILYNSFVLSNEINILFNKETNTDFKKITSKKEFNPVYNYSISCVKQNFTFFKKIKTILNERNKNNKIYFLGWHEAAVSYYHFRKKNDYICASNTSNFLLFSKKINSKVTYNLELNEHYKTLKLKPEIIIDFNNVINVLNNQFTNKFLRVNYQKLIIDKNIICYKLITSSFNL